MRSKTPDANSDPGRKNTHRKVVLASRPVGIPQAEHFRIVDID